MQAWEYCFVSRTNVNHGHKPEVFLTSLKRNNGSSHLVPVVDFAEEIARLGEEGWEMVAGVPSPAFITIELEVSVGSEYFWFKRPMEVTPS